MANNAQIKRFLIEINTCRRLWRSWNDNQITPEHRSKLHYTYAHRFLMEQILYSLSFRFIIRLYALMDGDYKNIREKLTFGFWLDSLESSETANNVRKEYLEIAKSTDFKVLQEKRHNFFAHNALTPRKQKHSYRAIFEMSRAIEKLYDKIVIAGQAPPIDWHGVVDASVVHETNCAGGIETNINNFFKKLNS